MSSDLNHELEISKNHFNNSSTNPFDDTATLLERKGSTKTASYTLYPQTNEPLWLTRNVKWPLQESISINDYLKLSRLSRNDILKFQEVTPSLYRTVDTEAESRQYSFGGLMGRVFTSGISKNFNLDSFTEDSAPLPLNPPRRNCVASSNGWIVAVLECVCENTSSLYFLSRWNIRCSNTENLIPLPQIRKIDYVFLDPKGFHVLMSSREGFLYYINTDMNTAKKLTGFDHYNTGLALADLKSDEVKVQRGLTTGSYVTCIGWDNTLETEESFQNIVLGTSGGTLYEYTLVDPKFISSPTWNDSDWNNWPLLLVKLNVTGQSIVSGVHFERVVMNSDKILTLLAVTSGLNELTRLHTYFSKANISSELGLRHLFSHDEISSSSLVELPGSIDYADLHIYEGGFAIRTEIGIYYGMTRGSNNKLLSRISNDLCSKELTTSPIVDEGMITYDSLNGLLPLSIAITPHHFITCDKSRNILFINRVSCSVVQKVSVEWAAVHNYSQDFSCTELIVDPRRPSQLWLRNNRSLVHISSTSEHRDVWKFTLQKCLQLTTTDSTNYHSQETEFDRQFELISCANDAERAVVTKLRAEFHLKRQSVQLAARYMAQCSPILMPFDMTATRLALPGLNISTLDNKLHYSISLEKQTMCNMFRNNPVPESVGNTGLITYLTEKLQHATTHNDRMACTIIGSWLIELHMHERQCNRVKSVLQKSLSSNERIKSLLSSNVHTMASSVILQILRSHEVDAIVCAKYAAASGDTRAAIIAYLNMDDISKGTVEALRILQQSHLDHSESLYYQNAATFLNRVPLMASKFFLARYNEGLSPLKLLPAFMQYERKRIEYRRSTKGPQLNKQLTSEQIQIKGCSSLGSEEANVEISIHNVCHQDSYPMQWRNSFVDEELASINYLEGVIALGCSSSAIYKYLISLYLRMDDEVPLLRFLSIHIPTATTTEEFIKMCIEQNGESHPLDLSYALRAVLKTGRHYRSAVRLYMGLGMRQQAVELAIKVDPTLARELAHGGKIDIDERKRLWLMIARHVASMAEDERYVVDEILTVLHDCGPEVLSIEDVLPLLPDVTQIDQFKEEICSTLTLFSSKIEAQMEKMTECSETCDTLRKEIKSVNNYVMRMMRDAQCAYTKQSVLNSQEMFYIFPSGYVVFESALRKNIYPYLNRDQLKRIETVDKKISDIRTKIDNYFHQPMNFDQEDIKVYEYHLEELQCILDGLIASECPLTGHIMVDTINSKFPNENEDVMYRKAYNHFEI